jgi:hypothetical protein
VAFLAALFVLYLLTREELSDDTARAAVLFTAVFPTAFFFFAPYSESLFLLLALLTFWGARRRRWVLAAVAGALAALTRNVGVLLALPLAVEAFHQWRERPRLGGRPLAGFVAAAGPLLGAGAYLWYWHHRIGDWFAPIRVENGWQRVFASPITTIGRGTRLAFQYLGIYPGGYHLLDWMIAVPVLCLAAYGAVRFRPAYGVYVWVSILPPLAFIFESRPFMSFPRFALPLFPLSWALARLTERSRVRRELAIAVSASALGFLALLFVNWYYIF